MKNVIKIITAFAAVILFSTSSFAVTGNASIENVQVAGPVFSFELHFIEQMSGHQGCLQMLLVVPMLVLILIPVHLLTQQL